MSKSICLRNCENKCHTSGSKCLQMCLHKMQQNNNSIGKEGNMTV